MKIRVCIFTMIIFAETSENFRNIRPKIYAFDQVQFPSTSGFAWEASHKKDKSKIRAIN